MPIKTLIHVQNKQVFTNADTLKGFTVVELAMYVMELERLKREAMKILDDIKPDYFSREEFDDESDDKEA